MIQILCIDVMNLQHQGLMVRGIGGRLFLPMPASSAGRETHR
jgi:hypothetical protein